MATTGTIDQYSLDEAKGTVKLTLNKGLYTKEVLFGTAYIFIDRAYVFLDRNEEGDYLVQLKMKEDTPHKDLEALVGEFSNELVNQLLRVSVSKRNAKIREAIVSRALFSNFNERKIFETDFGDEGDFLDDPLGIATPWEQKFKQELSEGAKAEKAKADAESKKG
jgi:His-Xaa-Ser system protein HxsD